MGVAGSASIDDEDAGSYTEPVAAKSEALLLPDTNGCGETSTQLAARLRSKVTSTLGGVWSWTGALLHYVWYGTGQGGRTAEAVIFHIAIDEARAHVYPSQGGDFNVVCKCTGSYKSCTVRYW